MFRKQFQKDQKMPLITTRQATFSEIEQLLLWAEYEGWNPGVDDAAAFYSPPPVRPSHV